MTTDALKIVETARNKGTKDWSITRLPDFKGRKAFVLPGAFYGNIVTLFAEAGFEKATSIADADVVVFAGGADIDPKLYDQKAIAGTYFNEDRDRAEQEAYDECIRLRKFMFGICRGAQFLHAMNEGELWQDVNNHGGTDHFIVDIDEDVRVLATSIHHQMLKINDRIQVLAVCEEQVATKFRDENLFIDLEQRGSNTSDELEIEAGYYEDTHCLFVQGHPEVGSAEYRAWTMNKLHDFMVDWEAVNTGPTLEQLL